MKIRLLVGGIVAALVIMAGFATEEILAKADGEVSATSLPFDQEKAKVKFETATFGLG